ncbi:hypothetical protein [Dubosiella muris]|uniref:Uncharacterized protein n=1 Tax=Dubosiella muris TaxID=3038133 RepID=A0AC61RAV5_9FIRM|nr:hypothetical protein [Dubosiella muris]TGY66908.1 hypothetical protein E5336_02150 [Dubosiella muris]
MSKYDPLWHWIQERETPDFVLEFDEIGKILGFPLDHSFLTFKKELPAYGFQVQKISMKNKTVAFKKEEAK